MRTLVPRVGWVLLSFGATVPGAFTPPDDWYEGIAKPDWTPVFFGAHEIFAAFVLIAAPWFAILATVLNFQIWRLNG